MITKEVGELSPFPIPSLLLFLKCWAALATPQGILILYTSAQATRHQSHTFKIGTLYQNISL